MIINKEDKIAITGINGAGKSTLFKALLGLYKKQGQLLFDGIDVNDLNSKSIRDLIAYVPQDPYIFNNTVMYNLCYAQETYDEEEIYEICKQYDLDKFFRGMKNGYFTETGENGKFLSGGQKQCINFIREIIKHSQILLLDEPTTNMDKKFEFEIMKRFILSSVKKTVLIIVHNSDLLKHSIEYFILLLIQLLLMNHMINFYLPDESLLK